MDTKFEATGMKTMIKSMWKGFGTEFKSILANLQRHKDLVEQHTSIAHFHDSAAHYRQYQADMDKLREHWETQLENEKQKKMATVGQWLYVGSQAEDQHREHQKIRGEYSTTATWIFKHQYIKDWIKSAVPQSPFLWRALLIWRRKDYPCLGNY
jgi:hypothetical protein